MEITIPENLNEITIQQYNEYLTAVKDKTNQDYIDRKMVEIFCNIKQGIREVDFIKFQEAVNILKESLSKEPKFQPTFTLDNVTYGFIPVLDKMSFGEKMDLDMYLADEDLFHRAMAVMFRPVIFKQNQLYQIEEYEGSDKYADIMLNAPLGVFQGAMVFFYHLTNDLLKATLPSLKEGLKTTLQHEGNSEVSGDGINQSMHLLMEMLQDSTKLQGLDFTNV